MVLTVNKIKKNIEQSKTIFQKEGLPATSYYLFHDVVARFTYFSSWKFIKLTLHDVNKNLLNRDLKYRFLFLDEDQIRKYSKDPINDISERFISRAIGNGDECLAALDSDVLASCGWYSGRPTHMFEDMFLHFDTDYRYMYKGYTHPNYRGERLHGIGMAKACEIYTGKGFKGLLSHIEAHNFNSLRSSYRIGYQDIGKIYVFRFFGQYRSFRDSGCKLYKCELKCLKP
jgi:hypothetical protein